MGNISKECPTKNGIRESTAAQGLKPLRCGLGALIYDVRQECIFGNENIYFKMVDHGAFTDSIFVQLRTGHSSDFAEMWKLIFRIIPTCTHHMTKPHDDGLEREIF